MRKPAPHDTSVAIGFITAEATSAAAPTVDSPTPSQDPAFNEELIDSISSRSPALCAAVVVSACAAIKSPARIPLKEAPATAPTPRLPTRADAPAKSKLMASTPSTSPQNQPPYPQNSPQHHAAPHPYRKHEYQLQQANHAQTSQTPPARDPQSPPQSPQTHHQTAPHSVH